MAAGVFLSFLLLLLHIHHINGVASTEAVLSRDDGNDKMKYQEVCTMANLLIATRNEEYRYAYGLTTNCLFFYFDLREYPTIEKLLAYLDSQWDLNNAPRVVCPVDMYTLRYVSSFGKPYFEILELGTAAQHRIEIEDNKKLVFKHFNPSVPIEGGAWGVKGWEFATSGWTGYYEGLMIYSKPAMDPRTGRYDIKTYVRRNNEAAPGGCIYQSFGRHLQFQMQPVLGIEAEQLGNYIAEQVIPDATVVKLVPKEEEPEAATILPPPYNTHFWGIIGSIIFSALSILICMGLITWQAIEFYNYRDRRRLIEKFVVKCYVEKLQKLSKALQGEKKSKKASKKKKKSDSSSYSRHHHRHRRHRSTSQSASKVPHGSKLIPLPNEKDLFATDKEKVEIKPVQVQEPRKSKGRDPSKGSNTSVCSLRSVTQSLDDSLDWTAKGVRVSKRNEAFQQYKEDAIKDEDEAYKLGMNVSTFKKKRKRQQHGLPEESQKNKVVATPIPAAPAVIPKEKSEISKPESTTTTNPSTLLASDIKPAEKSKHGPYRSLVVPASGEVPSVPQVKK